MSQTEIREDAKEEIPAELSPDIESEELEENTEPEETVAEPEETVAEPFPIQENRFSGSNSFSKSQQEENPSEPLPNVHTAAEPGQPADSQEEVAESEETPPIQVATSSTNRALSIENLEEEASTLVHLSESLSRTEHYDDKFTQTFFKYMKDLSDRRCVEIFNTEVNYEDNSLVFYRRSFELLQFVDVQRSRI